MVVRYSNKKHFVEGRRYKRCCHNFVCTTSANVKSQLKGESHILFFNSITMPTHPLPPYTYSTTDLPIYVLHNVLHTLQLLHSAHHPLHLPHHVHHILHPLHHVHHSLNLLPHVLHPLYLYWHDYERLRGFDNRWTDRRTDICYSSVSFAIENLIEITNLQEHFIWMC